MKDYVQVFCLFIFFNVLFIIIGRTGRIFKISSQFSSLYYDINIKTFIENQRILHQDNYYNRNLSKDPFLFSIFKLDPYIFKKYSKEISLLYNNFLEGKTPYISNIFTNKKYSFFNVLKYCANEFVEIINEKSHTFFKILKYVFKWFRILNHNKRSYLRYLHIKIAQFNNLVNVYDIRKNILTEFNLMINSQANQNSKWERNDKCLIKNFLDMISLLKQSLKREYINKAEYLPKIKYPLIDTSFLSIKFKSKFENNLLDYLRKCVPSKSLYYFKRINIIDNILEYNSEGKMNSIEDIERNCNIVNNLMKVEIDSIKQFYSKSILYGKIDKTLFQKLLRFVDCNLLNGYFYGCMDEKDMLFRIKKSLSCLDSHCIPWINVDECSEIIKIKMLKHFMTGMINEIFGN